MNSSSLQNATTPVEELRVSVVQTDVVWEDREANLAHVNELLSQLPQTDLVLLPEMFTTAFSMNARQLAEPTQGPTLCQVKKWAAHYQAAFVGSFIAEENGKYFNRGFFVRPDGTYQLYDKHHLFLGGEEAIFTPGQEPCIIDYAGWKINLAICYDLRFPVWLRNFKVNNKQLRYDLLLIIAEWPVNRQTLLENLLMARSIENQAYVCCCNRVGKDENYLHYIGGSQAINFTGKILGRCQDDKEEILTTVLSKYALESNREKAPVWKHGDAFHLD